MRSSRLESLSWLKRYLLVICLCGLSVALGHAEPVIRENAAVGHSFGGAATFRGHLYVFGLNGVVSYDTTHLLAAPSWLRCVTCSLGTVDGTGSLVLTNGFSGWVYQLPSGKGGFTTTFEQLVYRVVSDDAGIYYVAMRAVGIGAHHFRSKDQVDVIRHLKPEVTSIAATPTEVAIGTDGTVEVYSRGLRQHLFSLPQPSKNVQVTYDGFGRLIVLLPDRAVLRRYSALRLRQFREVAVSIGMNRVYADHKSVLYVFNDGPSCIDGKSHIDTIAFDQGSTHSYGGLRQVLSVTVGPDGTLYEAEQGCGLNHSPSIGVFKRGESRAGYRLIGAGLSDRIVAL